MVMTFEPVAVAAVSGKGSVGVSEDVQKEVAEAWDWFKSNPGFHLFTEAFEDEKAQGKWVRQAQAHAATLGLRLRVVRDDNQKALNKASGKPKVRFHIESQEAFEARQVEKAARAAEIEALKAKGVEIKRGRKPAAGKSLDREMYSA
jgi:hypothetical protein